MQRPDSESGLCELLYLDGTQILQDWCLQMQAARNKFSDFSLRIRLPSSRAQRKSVRATMSIWEKPIYRLRSKRRKEIVIDVTSSVSPGLAPNKVIVELIKFLKEKGV